MKKPSQKQKENYFKQLLYFLEHPNCEVCGEKSVHTHEIIFRSQQGKCESDNEIALCYKCHRRAHFLEKPYLTKDDLWEIKCLDIEKMREKYRLIRRGGKNA